MEKCRCSCPCVHRDGGDVLFSSSSTVFLGSSLPTVLIGSSLAAGALALLTRSDGTSKALEALLALVTAALLGWIHQHIDNVWSGDDSLKSTRQLLYHVWS
jgi:hypothetical protein